MPLRNRKDQVPRTHWSYEETALLLKILQSWKLAGQSLSQRSLLAKFTGEELKRRGFNRTEGSINSKIFLEKKLFLERMGIAGRDRNDSLLADIFLPIESKKGGKKLIKQENKPSPDLDGEDSTSTPVNGLVSPSVGPWTEEELTWMKKGFCLFADSLQENPYTVYWQVSGYMKMKGFNRDWMQVQRKLFAIGLTRQSSSENSIKPYSTNIDRASRFDPNDMHIQTSDGEQTHFNSV